MLDKMKNMFGSKKQVVPEPPKSTVRFTDWLYAHHSAYQKPAQADETGGPMGPEPTRYGTGIVTGKHIFHFV